ncbi:MAG: hypothetical protein GEU75_09490 [Dehalococcoidia bacterium]|nr:hypothetical protein [Dehalococcoidia bacterium]
MKPISLIILILVTIALAACTGDDNESEPEIVRSGGGMSESTSSDPPDIIRSQAGGAISSAGGPPVAGAQTGLSSLGLTVRHTESAEATADQAFLMALVQSRPPAGPIPFAQLPSRDQAGVIAAVEAVGVQREAVSFESTSSYGPFATISVRLPIDNLPDEGQRVLDAIESVVGRTQSGVRFAISDCAAALAPLRQAAAEGPPTPTPKAWLSRSL